MQKNQVWFIVGLVFAIIVTIFALANSSTVAISLIFYKFQASQALVIFFSAAVGAVISVLLGISRHFKIKSELKKLRKENETFKKNHELIIDTKDSQQDTLHAANPVSVLIEDVNKDAKKANNQKS